LTRFRRGWVKPFATGELVWDLFKDVKSGA
jgi:hypothetical protein